MGYYVGPDEDGNYSYVDDDEPTYSNLDPYDIPVTPSFPGITDYGGGDYGEYLVGDGGAGTSYTVNPDGTITVNSGTGGYTPRSASEPNSGITDALNKLLGTAYSGKQLAALAGVFGGGVAGLTGALNPKANKVGYQGGIPKYDAVRNMVTAPDPSRRPGSGGTRYGGDVSFVPKGSAPVGGGLTSLVGGMSPAAPTSAAQQLINDMKAVNTAPTPRQYDAPENMMRTANPSEFATNYAVGGMAKGRYLQGETDGMADKIPAQIGKDQPAALSHGEFVIPADVVSHLGNGNSDAGAKKLYSMMDKIRQARTGTKKQGKKINADKFMPGGLAQGYAKGGLTDDYFSVLEERDLSNPRYREYLAKQQGLEGSHPEMFAAPIARGLGSLAKTARGMLAPPKRPQAWVENGPVPGSVLQNPIGAPVPELTAADLERFLKAARSPQHLAKQQKHFSDRLPQIAERNLMQNSPRNLYNAFVEARDIRDLMDERQKSSGMAAGGAVASFAAGGTTPTAATAASAGVTGTEQAPSSWAGDYITNMLGKGQALAEAPYQEYGGPLTAGASPLQQQAFGTAANLSVPGSVGTAAQTAGDIAGKAQGMAYTPAQFTNQFNAPTAGTATNFTNQFQAPGQYQNTAFTSGTFGGDQAQQYMNPYLQTSLNPQLAEARRQSDITEQQNKAAMTKAGAFGGGRQAILTAEGQRNLGTNLANITGKGYDTAYQNAMAQYNADQARNMQAQQASEQSKQFGAQQGMTAAQMMAQYGMSAQQAQEAARQFQQQQAMTGAQSAAQFGQSAQTAAEQSRQFGAQQGLAGLNTALQAAQTQGNLGISSGDLGLRQLQQQVGLGAVQRGIESEGIAADKAAFEEARANPYKMLQFQQSLLQGLPITATNYNLSQPNFLESAAGGATTVAKLLDTLGLGVKP